MKYVLARVSFLIAWTTQHIHAEEHLSYGVDCSFPIHSKSFRCDDILGDRYQVYEDYMDGCRKRYGRKANRCDESENDRIAMNVRQPQSMVVRKYMKEIRSAHVLPDDSFKMFRPNKTELHRNRLFEGSSTERNHGVAQRLLAQEQS